MGLIYSICTVNGVRSSRPRRQCNRHPCLNQPAWAVTNSDTGREAPSISFIRVGGHSSHTKAQLPLFAEHQGLLSKGREGPAVRRALTRGLNTETGPHSLPSWYATPLAASKCHPTLPTMLDGGLAETRDGQRGPGPSGPLWSVACEASGPTESEKQRVTFAASGTCRCLG